MRSSQTLADLPGLLAQVHPEERAKGNADTLGVGSSHRLTWVCDLGHSWQAQVRARAQRGTGCPVCTNKQVLTGFNDLATVRPDLAAEWDNHRNATDPDQVLPGTPDKAWWFGQCGHSWQAQVRQRVAGSGCPFCKGKRVDHTNSLLSAWPEVASWWSSENPDTPDMLHRGSSEQRHFACPLGHQFSDTVERVVSRERKCPACQGWGLRPGLNDLATLRPDLVAEWADSNPPAAETTIHDKTGRDWICPRAHRYSMSPRARANGGGCPYCAGRLVMPGFNDLATLRPDLMVQWAAAPNQAAGIDATRLGLGSKERPHWRCSQGHSWRASVADRASGGTGCPVCSGLTCTPGVDDLATTHPDLAAQWHPTRNGRLAPTAVKASSGRRVWWRVAGCGHEWRGQVRYRSSSALQHGCAVCRRVVAIPGVNDVTVTHPAVTALSLAPVGDLREHGPGSTARLAWRCSRGHDWSAPIRKVCAALDAGVDPCPYCAGRRAEPGVNDVATLHPGLVQELDRLHHEPDVLVGLSVGSGRRLAWRCARGHSWSARVVDRIHHGTGCPECAAAAWRSRGEDEVADFLTGLGLSIRRAARVDCQGRRFNFDVAIDEARLLVEYNGTYYHSESTGRTAGYHAEKHRAAVAAGWSLVTVWEDDWRSRPDVVRSMLAHKVGRSGLPRVSARRAQIEHLGPDEARDFLDAHHIQGSGTGSVRIGLRHDGLLVAVLVARYEGADANIVRYATSAVVPGGFGRLLAALDRHLCLHRPDIRRVKTFSDNMISDGGLYSSLGFTHDGDVRPDYTYVRGRGPREHKFGYRLARFERDPALRFEPGLTERELADLNGLHRVWDAGKKRWVRPVTTGCS